MRTLSFSIIMAATLGLASCATTGVCDGNKEQCGTGIGGILGAGVAAVIANNVDNETAQILLGIAAVAGGAYLGKQYGKHLDEKDAKLAQEAAIVALNSRSGTSSWASETNEGVSGTVTVSQMANNNNCKVVDQLIVTANGSNTVQTSFCQQTDGTWKATA